MVTPRLNLTRIGQPGQVFQESVSQAGMVDRATQQLGQQIIETGSRIGSVVERRRAEEARDQISTAKSEERIFAEGERAEMELQFRDNPKGYAAALEKAQGKRRARSLKNIENPDARAIMEKEFEFNKLENRLKAVEYERTQFSKNADANIMKNSKAKADADFASPLTAKEFILDLDTDLLDIQLRDTDDAKKEALSSAVTDQRVNGVISGLIKGGSIRDYQRANELVDNLGNRISPSQHLKLKSKIDSDRIRTQNVRTFKERQETKAIKKQFSEEQRGLREVFSSVITDPDADITDQLKFAGNTGKINIKNPVVLSEVKMDDLQKSESSNLKYGMLEQLASTDDPTVLREKLHRAILSGQMSAEDGEDVLNSIQVRSDTDFKKKEYKFADNLLRNSVTRGFSFNKQVEREKLNTMIRQRDKLVSEFGIDPASASMITLKENGKMNLPGMKKVRGVKGDQNTIDGIEKVKSQLIKKFQNKTLSPNEFQKSIQLLEQREEALQEVPSIDELRGRQNGS